MNLTPGYGETPLPNDELAALLPAARDLLEPSLTKAAVYDLEQEIQDDITGTMVSAVLEGNIQLEELVTDFFLRELHFLLYGQVWDWAGKFRRRELNIGVAPRANCYGTTWLSRHNSLQMGTHGRLDRATIWHCYTRRRGPNSSVCRWQRPLNSSARRPHFPCNTRD